MSIKIKKNKDGSITKTITTVEETTISSEEVDAEIQWKKNQIVYLEQQLESLPREYEKKVELIKQTIEWMHNEIKDLESN